MNRILKISLLVAATLVATTALAQTGAPVDMPPQQWDADVVDLFASLPIQDDGRVKPVSTYAGFALLKLNGRREITVPGSPDKRKLSPTEWLLDTMFYPDAAARYEVFLIQSSEVVEAIGIKHDDKKKRDRYSYAELEPGIEKLFELAQQYNHESEGETKNLTPVQGQIVNLASNVFEYQQITHYFDFARHHFHVDDNPVVAELLPEPRYTAVLARATQLGVLAFVAERGLETIEPQLPADKVQELRNALPASFAQLDAEGRASTAKAINAIMHDAEIMSGRASGLALFPPVKAMEDQGHWLAAGEMMEHVAHEHEGLGEQVAMIADMEELVRLRDNGPAFKEQLRKTHGTIVAAAAARGEYSKVPIEVSFYKWDFFYRALMLYVLAFIAVAFCWLMPAKRWLSNVATVLLMPPTLLLIVGITYRCIIRNRPPVSTLYETILFITAVAVVVAILIELMNRQRIAMSIGAILGAGGMFLAYRFETQQGVDTMPNLVAVLDTNFWLSTHVTTVTMGYSAGLLAAAIAHVYIIGKLFKYKSGDSAFYKNIYRMTYGVLCFGLLFSVVGTVLGGIWANESWGRFWGWDPKENGALMIVLWELAILHGRLGGYLRDLGVAIASVFGAIIVAFSWWGVNLLGVGLHSYGFTSGIMQWLILFYSIEAVVGMLGFVVWYREKVGKTIRETPEPAADRAPGRKKQLPAKAAK